MSVTAFRQLTDGRNVMCMATFPSPLKTVVKLTKALRRGTPTIELDRPGKPPEELWNDNGDPRMVSWWTYRRSFSGNDLK